jgi:hypothetical protein
MAAGTKELVSPAAKKRNGKKQAIRVGHEFGNETSFFQLLFEFPSRVSMSGMNREVVPALKHLQCWDPQQNETVRAENSGHLEERITVVRDAIVVDDIERSHKIKTLSGKRQSAHVGLNDRAGSPLARELEGLCRGISAPGSSIVTQSLQHAAGAAAGVQYPSFCALSPEVLVEKGNGNVTHAEKPPELVLEGK